MQAADYAKIQGTVNNTDGTPFTGTITIAWTAFVSFSGQETIPGSMEVEIFSGDLDISLPAMREGFYTVSFADNIGKPVEHRWRVAGSGTYQLSSVEISVPDGAVGTDLEIWANQPGAAVPAIRTVTSDMLNGGTGLMVQNRVSPQSTPANFNDGRGVLIGDVGLNGLLTAGTEKIDMGLIRDGWSLLLNRNMKYDSVNACWAPIIDSSSYPYVGDLLELGAEGISMHVMPSGQSSNYAGTSGMIMSWRPSDVRGPDASGNDSSIGSTGQRIQAHAPIYITYTANNREYYHHGANNPALHILDDGTGLSTPIMLDNFDSTHRAGAQIQFRKSGGNPSASGQTIAATNDNPMALTSYAYDGATFQLGAEIITFVHGTPASGIVGQDIRFRTSSTNSAGITDRMTILYNGNVGVGTTAPNGLFSVGTGSPFQVDAGGNLTTNHIHGSTTLAPTIAAGAGLGTGATVNVFGNDVDMTVLVTTGTSPTTGSLFTITWATAYVSGQAPRCIAGPGNAAAASAANIWPAATLTTVTFAIQTALAASTSYQWYIHVAS